MTPTRNIQCTRCFRGKMATRTSKRIGNMVERRRVCTFCGAKDKVVIPAEESFSNVVRHNISATEIAEMIDRIRREAKQ